MANILVVDDDVNIASLFERILTLAGHTLYIARDGLQAIAILDTTPIDVLITDLRMPGLNGNDLVRMAHSSLSRPRIVVMSGDVRARGHSDAVRMADVVLAKPFRMPELLSVVGGLVQTA